MAFYPYLYFGGNCRAAMTRYQEIFGGDLEVLTGEAAPPGEVPDDKKDLVMHAYLKVDDAALMASDTYDDSFEGMKNVFVHYSTPDVDRARTVFEGLAEGGDVQMPGGEVFWSPFFGVVVDRFGTPWQVSADQEQP
jgi:PhnB protein